MAQHVGRVTITANGLKFNSKEGATLDPGGITRQSQTSDHDTGFSEYLRPAVCKFEIVWEKGGPSLTDLNGLADVTLQFRCDTGDVYVMEKAFRAGEFEGKAGKDASIGVEFRASEATAVTTGA